jgi:hypothetical protein
MPKSFDKISDSLNTETDIIDITPKESEIIPVVSDERIEQSKKDYEYTRGNLYSLTDYKKCCRYN